MSIGQPTTQPVVLSTAQLDLLRRKLWRAMRTLESIAENPPTLMHNADHHEVLVYSPGQNPTKMARECLEDIRRQSNVGGNRTTTDAAKPQPSVVGPCWPTC
jgi:hypothetical protein